MSDLSKKLRRCADKRDFYTTLVANSYEAATELERLEADNERLTLALKYISQGGNTIPVGTDYAKHLEDFARRILERSPSSVLPARKFVGVGELERTGYIDRSAPDVECNHRWVQQLHTGFTESCTHCGKLR